MHIQSISILLWSTYRDIYLDQIDFMMYCNESGILYSLSARLLHRAPPPLAPSGPKFSNSENCCGSENAMPPKMFWDMEGHRGNFRSKNVFFFSKNIFWKKIIINHIIF